MKRQLNEAEKYYIRSHYLKHSEKYSAHRLGEKIGVSAREIYDVISDFKDGDEYPCLFCNVSFPVKVKRSVFFENVRTEICPDCVQKIKNDKLDIPIPHYPQGDENYISLAGAVMRIVVNEYSDKYQQILKDACSCEYEEEEIAEMFLQLQRNYTRGYYYILTMGKIFDILSKTRMYALKSEIEKHPKREAVLKNIYEQLETFLKNEME